MSRFTKDPYKEYETKNLIERVVAMGPIHYHCGHDRPLPPPVIDRDPGDEDPKEP